jgi:hypothetical protein
MIVDGLERQAEQSLTSFPMRNVMRLVNSNDRRKTNIVNWFSFCNNGRKRLIRKRCEWVLKFRIHLFCQSRSINRLVSPFDDLDSVAFGH